MKHDWEAERKQREAITRKWPCPKSPNKLDHCRCWSSKCHFCGETMPPECIAELQALRTDK